MDSLFRAQQELGVDSELRRSGKALGAKKNLILKFTSKGQSQRLHHFAMRSRCSVSEGFHLNFILKWKVKKQSEMGARRRRFHIHITIS